MHGEPLRPFALKRFLAFGAEPIVLSSSAAVGDLPPRLNQALLLKPVEDRVEHPVGPFEMAVGEPLDFLDDRVTVVLASREDREKQRPCRGTDQVFGRHGWDRPPEKRRAGQGSLPDA